MQADIGSILIYLGTLFITAFLAYFYECYDFTTKIGRGIFRCIVLLPFSLLAGLRSNVGVDYKYYVVIIAELSRLSLNKALAASRYEPGFVVIVKLAQFFVKDRWFCFFMMEFVTMYIAMLAFERIKNRVSLTVMMIAYYMFVYHLSLNIMRQVLAMSFVFLAVTYIMDNKLVKAVAILLIATRFHDSSAICFSFVLVPLLYNFKLFNVKDLKAKKEEHSDEFILFRIGFKRAAYYFTIFASTLMIGRIINIAISVGIISSYYAHYFKGSGFGVGNLIYAFFFLGPAIILCKDTIENNYDLCVARDIVLLYLPISFVGYYAKWATRLKLYPELVLLMFAPMLCTREKNGSKSQVMWVYYALIILYYYVNYFLILNQNDTFPYYSIL